MNQWCFADVWDTVAELLPDAPALVHGDVIHTWSAFERRSAGVGATLIEAGVPLQGKFAQYLHNEPAYLESVYAAWKVGCVPVNTNYRYADDELVYLWDNADVDAVVFHGTFTSTIERIRARVPRVRTWLHVDDGTEPCPDWAIAYEDATGGAGPSARRRTGDDLYLLYTGGTTGMPKGVMWRQDDLFRVLSSMSKVRFPGDGGLSAVRELVTRPGPVTLPACPLMHGTGSFSAFSALSSGGSVVTLTGRRLDIVELLDTIEQRRVQSIAIVGDAFAKPLLRALDEEPERWDISSLRVVTSSGVMWSSTTKEGLLRHNERLILVDSLGSSEALGLGSAVTTNQSDASPTASFSLSADARVLTDDGRFVEPGSGEVGMLARRGLTPIGYYKDEEKTAVTFRVVNGERYSIPGDYATVSADGTLVLLGRGSVCINTGGEKVFPEEVEEALKEHPSVSDAVVIGVPDERFGEIIVAVVEGTPGAPRDAEALVAHTKGRLASYKAPKHVLFVPGIDRADNGKVDYSRWKAFACAARESQ